MECVNTFYLERHLKETDSMDRRIKAIKDFLYSKMHKEIAEVVFEEMAETDFIDVDVSHNCLEFLKACIEKHGFSGIFAEIITEEELEESLWTEAAFKWSESLDY